MKRLISTCCTAWYSLMCSLANQHVESLSFLSSQKSYVFTREGFIFLNRKNYTTHEIRVCKLALGPSSSFAGMSIEFNTPAHCFSTSSV